MNSPRAFFHRRDSLRLPSYDYSAAGAYFVTICIKDRVCLLGDVVDGELMCNDAAWMVQAVWEDMPHCYTGVVLDAFVVMPNHVHGILIFTDTVRTIPHGATDGETLRSGGIHGGAIHELPLRMVTLVLNPGMMKKARRNMGLSKIVGRFKMNSAKRINEMRDTPGVAVWQRNYYEHIIRNEETLDRLRQYITNNPVQWALDRENPAQAILRTDDR